MGHSGSTTGQSETTRVVNWHLKLVGGWWRLWDRVLKLWEKSKK